MERQNDRRRSLRLALCGALVSLTAYLLGLMLWTHWTLSDTVSIERMGAGVHVMMALAAALGAAVCALRGEVRAASASALGFWLSVLLIGALCGGGVAPRAALARAAACGVGALAALLPFRRGKKRRRRSTRGKHKRRSA